MCNIFRAIKADPLKLHADLQKVYKMFIISEDITVKEASALLKKPREGTATYPFKRPKLVATQVSTAQPNKRARVEEENSESGR